MEQEEVPAATPLLEPQDIAGAIKHCGVSKSTRFSIGVHCFKTIMSAENEITILDIKHSLDDLTEFLKENMVTQDEFRSFKGEMLGFKKDMLGFKGEMLEFKQDMLGFKGEMLEFKQNTEQSFDSISSKIYEVLKELEEVRTRLESLENRTIEDANVAAGDILHLRKRVGILEEQAKVLRARQQTA